VCIEVIYTAGSPPAIKAEVTDHVWSCEELVDLIDRTVAEKNKDHNLISVTHDVQRAAFRSHSNQADCREPNCAVWK
jgi:hypothetical protein